MNIDVIGYGSLNGLIESVQLIRETKTMIIVEWGKKEKRFRKSDGYAVGTRQMWTGWKLADVKWYKGEINGLSKTITSTS